MRILVDTGVFSASLSRRRRPRLEAQIGLMAGHQIFLAAVTVSELRYGALVAQWGEARRDRLDESIGGDHGRSRQRSVPLHPRRGPIRLSPCGPPAP